MKPFSHLFVPLLGLGLALGLPALASAKAPSNKQTVATAKASPKFRGTLKRKDLGARGLKKINVTQGVQMDFGRYVTDTALNRRPELAPLFKPKVQAELLKKPPTYSETIYELDDRLVIERTLIVPLRDGACKMKSVPKAVKDLCFTKNPSNPASKAVSADLARIRAKLARVPRTRVVKGKVTAAQALRMSDSQLLEFLLNSDARTISHVSIVPRQTKSVKSGLVAKLPGTASSPSSGSGQVSWTGGQHVFDKKYFLTGFTYGKEIDDYWEYTFANSTWLTDRYYVRIDYHLGLGFGVRAPFSVAVKSGGNKIGRREIEMSVAPVNVDSDGKPAYPAVGLPQNKYFGGKEFVLEFSASCRLYISIPGPNFDRNCPKIDKSYSRDVNPVIGTDTSKIADWWLSGNTTGLKVSAGVGSARLDLGLGADVANGTIGMRAAPHTGSQLVGLGSNVTFTNTSARTFAVTRTHKTKPGGFRLSDPRYGFDIRLTPKLRAVIEVDVAIYENSWTLGPYPLDFLSISKNFQLSRHDGTVEHHDYSVFTFTQPEAKLPESPGKKPTAPGKKTPPPAKKPAAKPAPGKLPPGGHKF